jgi:hypothetical protein
MPIGLPVSRLISVAVNLAPNAAPTANFDSLLIVGDSDVINVQDRIRSYNTIASVASDFGTTAPEYLAALLFFSQVPQPAQLYIGRWAKTATHGLLVCGALSATQKLMSSWTSITTGSLRVTVDGGSPINLSGLNFASATNLNGVASVINAPLSGTATVTYDGTGFVVRSNSTGVTSTVSALSATGSGADISAQMNGTIGTLSEIVAGIAPETALEAVVVLDGLQTGWYALTFAAGTGNADISDADHLAVAAYVEASGIGSGNPHVYGITTAEPAAITTNDTSSIGYEMQQLGYNRTLVQYSTTSPYAICSFFGRAFTVDFNGSNTTITMMWKQEPGVVGEQLSSTQADALNARNYNYFGKFNNNTSIIVNGTVASGQFFDTIWGVDWFANRIQTDLFNLLYTTFTKIPQTDYGVHLLTTQVAASCDAAVNNALLAPGTWTNAGFGTLKENDFLPKGYYVFAPLVATQNVADRAARKAPPIQVAAKLAGAIHTVSVTINVAA